MLRQALIAATALLLTECDGSLLTQWCVDDVDCNPNNVSRGVVSCNTDNRMCVCGVFTTQLNAGNGPCVGDDVLLDTEETTLVSISAEYRFESASCVRSDLMEVQGRAIFNDMFGAEPLYMNFTGPCGNRNDLRNTVVLTAFYSNISFAKAKTVDSTLLFTTNQFKYPEIESLGPPTFVDVRGGGNVCKAEFPTAVFLTMAGVCVPVLCEYSYEIQNGVCTFIPYDPREDSLSGGAISGIVTIVSLCCSAVAFTVYCMMNPSTLPEDVCILFIYYYSSNLLGY